MKRHSTKTEGMTIGVDVGDRKSRGYVIDASGARVGEFRAPTTRAGFGAALRRYPGATVVIEVGTHSPWLSRYLEEQGHPVVVANPRRVRLIAEGDEKTDRTDAETLARLGRADTKLLRPVHHRGEAAQRDLAQLRIRDALVRSRASLIQQARGVMKSLGTRLPVCSTKGFVRRVRELQLPETECPGFGELLEEIESLTLRIRKLDQQIERTCQQRYPETQRLRQVAGVGPLTSLAYVLTLEDPSRFPKSRQVGPYLGLCPKKRESGDRQPQLPISKRGDVFLRRLLIQAAHYILGPFGPDTDLRRFGMAVIARGGKGAKKRALTAVARKLAVLLHRLWVTGESYVPLGYEHLDQAA